MPGPGEAIVRPLAVARCGLDPIMAAHGIFPGPSRRSRSTSRRRHRSAAGDVHGRFDPLTIDTTVVPFDDAAEAWLEPATKLVLRA